MNFIYVLETLNHLSNDHCLRLKQAHEELPETTSPLITPQAQRRHEKLVKLWNELDDSKDIGKFIHDASIYQREYGKITAPVTYILKELFSLFLLS